MTRNEQYTYNAENYPASVLTWLNEATDRAYNAFEQQTCANCIHDYCGCSVQDSILQVDPDATFDTFGCNSFVFKDIK